VARRGVRSPEARSGRARDGFTTSKHDGAVMARRGAASLLKLAYIDD
jgi:hypothetical protein